MTDNTVQTCPQARMSGDERYAQLLRIAIKLFSEKGFSGTTTKEIANEAGISEAMVFRHFSNKDDLYNSILDYKAYNHGKVVLPWENEEMRILKEKKDDYGFFFHLAFTVLENHEKDYEFLRLLLHSALEGHKLSEMVFDNFVSKLYEFVGDYLRVRQEEGEMLNIEPNIIIRAFLGMLMHHSLNNLLWDKSRRLLDITTEQAAHHFASILLNGIVLKKS